MVRQKKVTFFQASLKVASTCGRIDKLPCGTGRTQFLLCLMAKRSLNLRFDAREEFGSGLSVATSHNASLRLTAKAQRISG